MSTISRRGRSRVAVFAVVAVLASLLALPLPAGAATAACPDSIPSAGFTDMAGYSTAAQDAVDCIADYGVTAGIGGGLYGPAQNVPRWQMAIFLASVLETGGATLDSSAFGFSDISGLSTTAQDAINAIANAGVTAGVGGGLYGPDANVPRWQMALFLAAVLKDLGVTLDTSAFGFTDIAGESAAAQDAINAVANAGISAGVGGGLFAPDDLVTRVQMALFLAAELDEAGVVPTGLGAFIWKVDTAANKYYWADPAACASNTVTYLTTDKFFIDGSPATLAAFELALDKLDVVGAGSSVALNNGKASPTAGVHNLTTGVKVTSGYVADATLLTIEEPVSGNVLADLATGAAFEFYVVDGTATTLTGFTNDLSVGDMIAQTGGNGTTAAKARTFTLTNASVSGAIDDAAGIDIETACQVFDVGVPAGTDAISIDGSTDTLANFNLEKSAGDGLVYSYAAGKGTWALTNAAPSVQTGEAAAQEAGNAFVIYKSATSTPVAVADVTTFDVLKVNGAVATPTDFLTALTPGDAITWQDADAITNTDSMLAVTDAAYSGAPAVNTAPGSTSLSVYSFGTAGTNVLDLIAYGPGADVVDPLLGLTLGTGGHVKFSINGGTASAANIGAFSTAVDFAIASNGGSVSVAKVGVDIVWSVTTP